MKLVIVVTTMLVTVFGAFSQAAEQKYLPTPPTFSTKTDMKEALLKYPLGVITKEVAFAHHGQPTRKITLPNGAEGWVYQVGEGFGLRTYTLEFGDKGIITDVLYNENGRHNGLTALQLQAQAKKILGPDAETPPPPKHKPEEFRYQK